MSLEDDFSDVIAKAMKGLELGVSQVAEEAGVGSGDIKNLLDGEMNLPLARKVSQVLCLDADALVALPGYMPEPLELPGIRRIELPFRQWTVNAWLIEKGNTRLLFDAGLGKRDVLERVPVEGINAVFITHGHEDHIGGVAALRSAGAAVFSETDAMLQNLFSVGDLTVRAVDLSGHKSPAVGYFVEGLDRPVCVVGDAIFAGSMGGCQDKIAFRLAFKTLREAFRGIADDCVVLPGHGPATTLGEEKKSNPFRAAFS